MAEPHSDIVIVGAGIAGLIAAREAIINQTSYTILEAGDQSALGGRVKTETINLAEFAQESFPPTYKFEVGGAWLHGISESKTLALLDELHFAKSPDLGPNYISQSQVYKVFDGCAWNLPELVPYHDIVLFDPQTGTVLDPFLYAIYLIITVEHLRPILRKYASLDLNVFAQEYTNWVVNILPTLNLQSPNAPSLDPAVPSTLSDLRSRYSVPHKSVSELPVLDAQQIAGVLGRAVGWFFASVECYNGVPIGDMASKDLFYPLTNRRYGDRAVFEADLNQGKLILGEEEKFKLEALLQKWLLVFSAKSESGKNGENGNCEQNWTDLSIPLSKLYQESPYCELDTEPHGCYAGPHCVLRCGMKIFVELLVDDIERRSGKPLNIKFNHLVTELGSSDDSAEGEKRFDVVWAVDQLTKENVAIKSNKAVLMTCSMPALRSINNSLTTDACSVSKTTGTCEGPEKSKCEEKKGPNNSQHKTQSDLLDSLTSASLSVYYKKVLHCFSKPWWPNPERVRAVGVFQVATDMRTISPPHSQTINQDDPRDFSEGNGYNALFAALDEYGATKGVRSDEELAKIPNVNIFFESHFPSKGLPVLSASLVGNMGKYLTQHKSSEGSDRCQRGDLLTLTALEPLYRALQKDGRNDQKDHNAGQNSPALPTPLFSKQTNWGENPNFGHSYSLITDCDWGTSARCTAGAKVGVFFAGEGVDVYETGSIHAAIITAEAAVKFIVDGVTEQVEEDEDEWSKEEDEDDGE